MIRWICFGAIVALVALSLYLPAAVPPDRFLEVLQAENQISIRTWGYAGANRIMTRMIGLQDVAQGVDLALPAPQLPQAAQAASDPRGVNPALEAQMAAMKRRLANSTYFRAMDSLTMLAMYRIAVLHEFRGLALVFLVVSVVDGLVMRVVRSKEFLRHSAEAFAVSACLSVLLLCAICVATVIPIVVHPLYFAAGLLLAGFLTSRTAANYHRHG